MIITIDGLGGTGKSTQAKKLAENINFKSFDTGAIYRLITLKLINDNIDPRNKEKLERTLNELNIKYYGQKFFLDNVDVSNRIRQTDISLNSAYIATVKEVKEKVLRVQRRFGEHNNVVMEGRDIGTRVFPNSDVKFYLEASPQTRALRRFLENNDKKVSYEEILENLLKRDNIEIKAKSILIPHEAIRINTDNMSFNEVNQIMTQIVKEKIQTIERG